jgi:hypothetical protein
MNRFPNHAQVGFALIALSCIMQLGCGSPTPTASVSGAVTLDDQPLKGKVHLSFVGADNVPRTTTTDDMGKFVLNELPVGEVVVIVSEATMPEIPPASGRQAEGTKAAPRAKATRRQGEVPAIYSDAGKPLLRYTLSPGDNTLAIQLKSAK